MRFTALQPALKVVRLADTDTGKRRRRRPRRTRRRRRSRDT